MAYYGGVTQLGLDGYPVQDTQNRSFPITMYVVDQDIVLYAFAKRMQKEAVTVSMIPDELMFGIFKDHIADLKWLLSRPQYDFEYPFGIQKNMNQKLTTEAEIKLKTAFDGYNQHYDTLVSQLRDDAIHFMCENEDVTFANYDEKIDLWLNEYYPKIHNHFITALRKYVYAYIFKEQQSHEIVRFQLMNVFFYLWAFQMPKDTEVICSTVHSLKRLDEMNIIQHPGYA